jgi:DNA-binding CsgD family transcriptional regulator
VLRLLAEGKTHREIASLRGKSERTIANQLATAFARIGNSGRNSAIKFLLGAEASPHLPA